MISSIKPFAPLLLTFFLPRLINVYRSAKVAYKTRPPPRPLPKDAARAVNVLFIGACLFFTQMLGLSSSITRNLGLTWFKTSAEHQNIFWQTNSRLKIPTDTLFSRLANLRSDGMLTVEDELLKSKITSLAYESVILCSCSQADLWQFPSNISSLWTCHSRGVLILHPRRPSKLSPSLFTPDNSASLPGAPFASGCFYIIRLLRTHCSVLAHTLHHHFPSSVGPRRNDRNLLQAFN